ncbi:hypothetical protein ACLB2K_031272 [Fragaria x ananassa]
MSLDDMKKKLTELAKANEELLKKNTELLGKLKKAGSQIIEQEKERRADKNQIKALKIQLHKATNAQTKQIICVIEEKEKEEDWSKPVEEKDHSCREEQLGTQKFFEPTEPILLHSISPEDDELVKTDVDLSKLDKLVTQVVQMAFQKINEETSLKNKGQQAEGVKKYVKKRKQTVEKRKEEEWEYDTLAKRTKKNDIVIHGVNCNTNTWKFLDENVARHYKNWFDLNKDKNDDFRYWKCCDGIIDITKDNLKQIIQEGEITSNTIMVYLQMFKKEVVKKTVSVKFLDIEATVKHIMVFIKRVYDSTIYPLNQGELDPEEWRKNQGIEVDGYSMMSVEEKRTRRWILDQNVYQERYQLIDVLFCP